MLARCSGPDELYQPANMFKMTHFYLFSLCESFRVDNMIQIFLVVVLMLRPVQSSINQKLDLMTTRELWCQP